MHQKIRSILGISNRQLWSERISMAEVRRRWGDEEAAADKVKKRRLEWLGHLARMPDHRIPIAALFSWLPQARPRCGPKKRMRDVMRKDLKDIGVSEEKWFDEAVRLRAGWRVLYRDGVDSYRERQTASVPAAVVRDVVCEVCFRKFRRERDKTRHKCVDERRKPRSEQQGATQCLQCNR